jgi:hypothetical protein
MKKLVAASLLVFIAAAAWAQGFQNVKGNGKVSTDERNVGNFHRIHSSGSFDVYVTDGSNTSVKVEAEENLQQHIEVSVQGDALVIRSQKGYNLRATKPVKIHVTATALKAIRNSGSGNIHTENMLKGSNDFEIALSGSGNGSVEVEAKDVQASISGSGNLTLKGKTNSLDGKISGSGNIMARELQSGITSLKISGSGNAEVVATEKLSSKIAGSGEIKYWGNAVVESKVSGSGHISRQQ